MRGITSKIPPSNSAQPVKISYAGDAPMDDQRTPMGEKFPNRLTNCARPGKGICMGTALLMP